MHTYTQDFGFSSHPIYHHYQRQHHPHHSRTKYLSFGVHFGCWSKVCQLDVTGVVQQHIFRLDVPGIRKSHELTWRNTHSHSSLNLNWQTFYARGKARPKDEHGLCWSRTTPWAGCVSGYATVQFSPLTDWVIEGTLRTIQQRSSSGIFYRRPLWAVLAWAGMSTLWCCPSSIFSANHTITHPPRCPERRFDERWKRLSWRVTCPNHANFCLLTVARRGSCGPTRKFDLVLHPVVGPVVDQIKHASFQMLVQALCPCRGATFLPIVAILALVILRHFCDTSTFLIQHCFMLLIILCCSNSSQIWLCIVIVLL